ncbi:MAG: hypothetical protein KGY50_03080 [Candidatus Thermoplasmatota archaeon]|nr:hypothetical protein [Candidatus Thermoplasmatota archaeon]
MNVKNGLPVLGIIAVLFCLSISAGYANPTINEAIDQEKIPMEPLIPIKRSIRPMVTESDYKSLPTDIPITTLMEDEAHPSLAVDNNGNPFVIFDKQFDLTTSGLGHQYSPDRGETWPEENYVEWDATITESFMMNPEISLTTDGTFAFGTYETGEQAPQVNLLIYPDITDYETWSITYFDRTGSSSYVKETTATTKGENILTIAYVTDYDTSDVYMQDTIVINWNAFRGDDTWPGVIFYNTDANDVSEPLSHLTSGAGEKVFICAERANTDGTSSIQGYYCEVDETTEYTDWRSAVVAGGRSNCTNPDVSVSGSRAYCVYMDDRNGNQDVYVATTTSGGFWMKYKVADSVDDELYPVISANDDEATVMFIKNNDVYSTMSEDAGKTWSDPVMINDDEGTAVAEFGNLAIDAGAGVWTSNVNDNLDLFFDEVGSAPIISIGEISGGFGVKATVSNVGNAPAEGLEWSLDLDGAVFVGAHADGTIDLAKEASVTINTGFVLGFGSVEITVAVGDKSQTASGFILGPFVFLN